MHRYVGQTIRYATLPGIIPWLKSLGLNFGYMAFLMAIVFRSVQLLPAGHPYLLPQNMGRFGIRQVLAAGAHNLKGGIRNIDQYLIFLGFLVGVVLLIAQFGLLFMAIAIHAAEASPIAASCGTGFCFSIFNTAKPGTDVAFVMLDYVFQIPGMFNSMVMWNFDTNSYITYADISPHAKGLHYLLAFYSRGMLIIAILIVCYYLFVVLVETAQTGVPFGARFASVYVPIRLVLALTLLVPVHYSLNSGQWLTLQMAKMGSSLATNAWLAHNNNAGDNPLGLTMREMVVSPHIEDVGSVVAFFQLSRACEFAYKLLYNKDIKAYVVRPATLNVAMDSQEFNASSNFANTLTFTGNRRIRIVNGEKDTTKYGKHEGFVKPYCGAITMDIDSINVTGVRNVYQAYFDTLKIMWTDTDLIVYGLKTALIHFSQDGKRGDACGPVTTTPWGAVCSGTAPNCKCEHAGYSFLIDVKQFHQVNFDSQMTVAINLVRSTMNDNMRMTPAMLDLGWGGAGVWFTRLGEYNGALVTAAAKIPLPTSMPAVMEFVEREKLKKEPNTTPSTRYDPSTKSGAEGVPAVDWKTSDLDDATTDFTIARYLNVVFRQLNGSDMSADLVSRNTKNPIMNTINQIYGVSGLYELRRNTDVIPLSRLAALGRSLIERSITFIGGALVLSGLGGIMGASDVGLARGLSTASGMITTIGMVSFSMGVTLYYVIPLMPFLYFFFAVGRWVKTIFEAMVGIPLWALAHIKIDGDGIPGQAAANGYFLMLEILIRPILTVFGLLAAMSIFNASAVILDSTFNLVVKNVGGYDPYPVTSGTFGPYDGTPRSYEQGELSRGAIDEFIYTIIYAIILYIIGTSAFKLIDYIPNGVLRFAGSGVSSFADKSPDPLDNMIGYVSQRGQAQMYETMKEVREGGAKAGEAISAMMGDAGVTRGMAQGQRMGTNLASGMAEKMKK